MDVAAIQTHPGNDEPTISEQFDGDHGVESMSDSTAEVSDFEIYRNDDAAAEHPENRAPLMPGIDLSEEQRGKSQLSSPCTLLSMHLTPFQNVPLASFKNAVTRPMEIFPASHMGPGLPDRSLIRGKKDRL